LTLQAEDDVQIATHKITPASLVPPASEQPLQYDLRTLFASKFQAAVRDRHHSVWLRMEGAKKWKLDAAGAAKQGEDDDVIEEGEDAETLALKWKCPISMAAVSEPLMNPACKHSMNADAIMHQFKVHGTVSCPVRGCKEMLVKHKLVPNDELAENYQRAMRRKSKSKRSREEDEEDAASAKKRRA
jgi:hypothetical protein